MTEREWTYSPDRYRRVYIEDVEALRAAVKSLEQSDVIGVDVEMGQRVERKPGGQQEWSHVLALIQIANRELSVVIDPLRCRDLSPLAELMAGPVRKVFLGGGQDAGMLERANIPARHIADVGEVALALFGRREDGMAALAQRIFGLSLDKTIRRTDWLARPLNPVLIAYAHRDAELTLAIYDWFTATYPETLQFHERLEFEPGFPSGTPEWLKLATVRSAPDPLVVLAGAGIDPAQDPDRVVADIRRALEGATAPRQQNKLIRLAGELGLRQLLPDITALSTSRSSLVRASVAKALGQMGTPEESTEVLQTLAEDPLEEVKRAAQSALKELRTARPAAPAAEEEDEETPALGGEALAALQRLRDQLEGE